MYLNPTSKLMNLPARIPLVRIAIASNVAVDSAGVIIGSIFEAKAIFAAMDEARDKSAAAAAATASAAPRVSRPKEYAEGELREALFTALHDVESGKMTYKDLKARLNPAREEDLRRLLDERSNLCMKEKNGNKVYYKIHPDIAGNR